MPLLLDQYASYGEVQNSANMGAAQKVNSVPYLRDAHLSDFKNRIKNAFMNPIESFTQSLTQLDAWYPYSAEYAFFKIKLTNLGAMINGVLPAYCDHLQTKFLIARSGVDSQTTVSLSVMRGTVSSDRHYAYCQCK